MYQGTPGHIIGMFCGENVEEEICSLSVKISENSM
jgi:hypothetical protein